MSLTGKTAVVTGSNSGIGLGIAECLAARGATLRYHTQPMGFQDV